MLDSNKNTADQSQSSKPTKAPASAPATHNVQHHSPVHRALVIVGGILVIALLGLSFFGGYVVGENKADAQVERFAFNKRQLTENLDRPINERPLLKQLPERIKRGFQEHGLRGSIVELNGDHMVVDTPNGARSVAISAETKFFTGTEKEIASRDDLKVGTMVMVLSKPSETPAEGEIMATVIIIDPAMTPHDQPQGARPGPIAPFES
jgi:hypothetical protein